MARKEINSLDDVKLDFENKSPRKLKATADAARKFARDEEKRKAKAKRAKNPGFIRRFCKYWVEVIVS